jgi:hypothetical protein
MNNLSRSKNIWRYLKYSGILSVGYILIPTDVLALASVDFAIKEICSHMEGSLGGLLMATAGVGGIISAAFGNMKAMYSCIVTAIGAFAISSMLSLHFPEAANKCSNGGGAGAASRSASFDQTNLPQVSRFDAEKAVKSYLSVGKEKENETGMGETESETQNPETDESESDLDLF